MAASASLMNARPGTQTPERSEQPDDQELLRRYISAGDREALSALLARHLDAAYRLALRFRGPADAEDAVQAACVDLLRRAGTFKPGHSFRAWFMGFVVNACRHETRAAVRRTQREEHVVAAANNLASDRPEQAAEHLELRDRVLRALAGLPEHYRIPLWLHHAEGLEAGEVAVALGVPENTIRSQLRRGLDELRQSLGAAPASLLVPVLAAAALESAPAGLAAAVQGMVLSGAASVASAGAAGSASGAGASQSAGALAWGGTAMKITAVCVLAAAAGTAMIATRGQTRETARLAQETKEAAPAPVQPAAPVAGPAQDKSKGLLGAPDFMPTPAQPVGWRGDGSGVYPGATPPLRWGRWHANALSELVAQGRKPNGEPARNESLGQHQLTDWLILGPFPSDDLEKDLDKEFVPNEGALDPDVNQALGGKTWQHYEASPLYASFNGAGDWGIDFAGFYFGDPFTPANQAAYAHTNLWVPAAQKARLRIVANAGIKVWLNGKVAFSGLSNPWQKKLMVNIDLQAGWNRLTLKSTYDKSKGNLNDKALGGDGWTWNVQVHLFPAAMDPYASKNVKWMVNLPGGRYSSPLAVGDKLFVTMEPFYLLCFDKNSGKLLWWKSHSNLVLGGQELEKSNPAAYSEQIKPLQDQVAKLNEEIFKAVGESVSVCNPKPLPEGPIDQRGRLEWWEKGNATLKQFLDKTVYKDVHGFYQQQNECGGSVGTPCSDGEFVYVWHADSVGACYTLDGKQVWMRKYPWLADAHHGWTGSPVLAGDKMVVILSEFRGLNKKTGNLDWNVAKGYSWSTPLAFKMGSEDCVAGGDGYVYRVSDGKVLTERMFGPQNLIPSPVQGDDCIFQIGSNVKSSTMDAWKIPGSTSEAMPKIRRTVTDHGGISSPVWHDGVLYSETLKGELGAWDTREDKELFFEYTPDYSLLSRHGLPGMVSSLAAADGRLYATSNFGNTLVSALGRRYRQLAVNRFASAAHYNDEWGQNFWVANPVLDGRRIYVRATRYLICLEYPEVEQSIKDLASPDRDTRLNAAEALADQGAAAKAALPALLKALGDTDGLVRLEAAAGMLANEPAQAQALDVLAKALADDKLRDAAARDLRRLNPQGPAREKLAAALAAAWKDAKGYPSIAAVEALEDLDPKNAQLVPACVELLRFNVRPDCALKMLERQGAAASAARSAVQPLTSHPQARLKALAEATLKAIGG